MTETNGKNRARYLTPEEAGARYGFRPEYLRRLARAGQVPYLKFQKLIRFDTVEMDAWMESHRREGVC